MLLLGAHVSISGGLDQAVKRGEQLGCTAIQIFTKNQLQWHSQPLSSLEVNAFARSLARSPIKMVAAHAGYLINLGSDETLIVEKSRQALIEEIDRTDTLRIPFLIVHPGAHRSAGESNGLRRIVEQLRSIFHQRPNASTRLLLETTAGQGTNLGYRFEQLRWIIDEVGLADRLGVCLDMCHAFAAGYEFRTREGYERTIGELDRIIGLKNLHVIHVNDSRHPLGSRIDRHENIGQGQIGMEGFRWIMNDPRLESIPKLLETPGGLMQFKFNLDILKALRHPHETSQPSSQI